MFSYTYNIETLITKINATPYESASVYFKEGFCYWAQVQASTKLTYSSLILQQLLYYLN